MSNDSINIRLSKIEESLVNSINRNTNFLGKVVRSNNAIDDSLKNVSGRELNFDGYAQVLLTSAGGTAVKADTDLIVQEDPEHRMGWNLYNQVGGTKFNLYYFNGTQEIITLNQIQSVYFKGFVNVNSEASSIPFIHIYTKPTGSGDAGAWYHSKIDYLYNSDNIIGIGEECLFYGEGEPKTKFTNRSIQLNNKVVTGDGEPSEEILYIAVSSDSGATAGAVNVTLNTLGFDAIAGNIGNFDVYRNLVLVSESSLTGGATEAKQDDMLTDLNSIDTELSTINSKITKGNDFTLTEAQQVLVYGEVTSGPGTGELHPIHITNSGDVEVEIADMVKGQNTMNQSFPVVISSDQSTLSVSETFLRATQNLNFTVSAGSNNTSAGINMSPAGNPTYRQVVIFGETDNVTDLEMFIQFSNDNINWYTGGYNEIIQINIDPLDPSKATFYKLIDSPPQWIRLLKLNSTGSTENLTVKSSRIN